MEMSESFVATSYFFSILDLLVTMGSASSTETFQYAQAAPLEFGGQPTGGSQLAPPRLPFVKQSAEGKGLDPTIKAQWPTAVAEAYIPRHRFRSDFMLETNFKYGGQKPDTRPSVAHLIPVQSVDGFMDDPRIVGAHIDSLKQRYPQAASASEAAAAIGALPEARHYVQTSDNTGAGASAIDETKQLRPWRDWPYNVDLPDKYENLSGVMVMAYPTDFGNLEKRADDENMLQADLLQTLKE